MYFGEYLISNKVISEEQLLEALIYQLEHTPSFLRVFRDEKIVDTAEIFRLILKQLKSNSDFVDIIKSEKILNDSQIESLYMKQVENRKMLGAVLVELKILKASEVENMLLSFIKIKDQPSSEPKVDTVSTVQINNAALESMKELGLSIDGLVTEHKEKNIFIENYLNVFDKKMHGKFLKLITILKESIQNSGEVSNYINSLYGDLYVLKGSAMSANLELTFSLLNNCATNVESKLSTNNEALSAWMGQFLPLLEESLALLWAMRDKISIDGEENKLKSDPIWFQKYQDLLKKIT